MFTPGTKKKPQTTAANPEVSHLISMENAEF